MAIYAIDRITGTTDAGWQLTQKQFEDLLKKAYEAMASVGGSMVGVYRSCTGRGKVYVGSFPSLEAIEKHRAAVWSREGLGFGRYWTYESDILRELPPGS